MIGKTTGQPEDPAANRPRIDEAVAAARGADMVLMVVGDRPETTRESVRAEMPGDRSTLGLYGDQDALVEAIAATGKPIVTLLISGRPLAIGRLAEVSRALIEGWYLGQEGGNAFADVMFGRANPGGKLPVSFPRSVGELPVHYDRHPSADTFRYLESQRRALFPFGHGLSYTTFDVSAPRLASATMAGARTMVDVDVTNTGAQSGSEVVQLYVRDQVSSVPRPMLELKGFRRVTLKPGEKRTVSFELGPDELGFWDIDMKWTVEPGTFTVFAGNSSANLKCAELSVQS